MLCAVQGSPSWKRAPRRTVTAKLPSSRHSAASASASTVWPSWSVRTGSSIVFHVMKSQLSGLGSKTCTVPTGTGGPASGTARSVATLLTAASLSGRSRA